MKTRNLMAAAFALAVFAGCKKEDPFVDNTPKPVSKTFDLYIDYWNTTGSNPQISFDAENSSPEVKIDFKQTFTGIALPPNFTNVIIDNVRIIDANNKNYEITNILAYEWREDINGWKNDVEFIMNYEPIEDLDVVMVLDASASLGQDFDKVKKYATEFVDKLFLKNPNSQVGIVDFSDQINALPLTGDANVIGNYIKNISQGPFTSLYEAMDNGINTLQNSNAEGKTILTFTDGTDNNSKPEFTPTYLFNKLTNDPNDIIINSFTIGLEGNGGVDKPVLQDLAANGGVAAFPKNINQLESVFEDFSKSISNVYNLTYIRNQQVVPTNQKVKLKFSIKAKRK